MKISELFISIQGESRFAGLPCFFIRTTGCNLNCSYCDTQYARQNGNDLSLKDILHKVDQWPGNLVEITGGEPLLQEEIYDLCRELLARGKQVLIETNGSLDIGKLPPEVIRIMDVKCPDSGMASYNCLPNLAKLSGKDEVKFVIAGYDDYRWAGRFIADNLLIGNVRILFSTVFAKLAPAQLAEWMLADKLTNVRLQLQLHKYLWPNKTRGV